MKIPNKYFDGRSRYLSLARIVSEDSQHKNGSSIRGLKSSKDS